jgi:hypothetical protein
MVYTAKHSMVPGQFLLCMDAIYNKSNYESADPVNAKKNYTEAKNRPNFYPWVFRAVLDSDEAKMSPVDLDT